MKTIKILDRLNVQEQNLESQRNVRSKNLRKEAILHEKDDGHAGKKKEEEEEAEEKHKTDRLLYLEDQKEEGWMAG